MPLRAAVLRPPSPGLPTDGNDGCRMAVNTPEGVLGVSCRAAAAALAGVTIRLGVRDADAIEAGLAIGFTDQSP